MDGDGRQVEILYPLPDTPLGNSAVEYVCSGRAALRFILGSELRRPKLFARALNRDRVAIAVRGERVVGYATFRLAGRGPYAPSFADFRHEYGLGRGLAAYLLFYLVENRHRSSSRLYFYGINVQADVRRSGVGSALVGAIRDEAIQSGCSAIELEVASHHQEAIGFYLRNGFAVSKVVDLGPLRHVFLFSAVTKMELTLVA